MAFSVRWRKTMKNTSTCFLSVKTESLLVTIEKDGWQKGCFLIIFLVTWCPQTDIPSHCLLFSSLLQKYRKLSTGYQHHHLELTGRNVKKKFLITQQQSQRNALKSSFLRNLPRKRHPEVEHFRLKCYWYKEVIKFDVHGWDDFTGFVT